MKKNVVVLGGGIIGLAIASKLSRNFKVTVFEKENKIGLHQSGRNSGVLHCGLYYKPNSLKAQFAYNGIRQMINYCKENKIFHEICGKLVVACDAKETHTLDQLAKNGTSNGLNGLKFLSSSEVTKIEPNIAFNKVLLVPEEGIVDYKAVMESLKNDLLNNQGAIEYNIEAKEADKSEVKFSNGYASQYDYLINCTGLYSDITYTRLTKLKSPIKIIPFRGEYYKLNDKFEYLFNNLIYPTPNPQFPFLGIHFTRMYDGSKEIGPNAVFAFKREGYNCTDFSLHDTLESLTYSGLHAFMRKNFKFALNEFSSSLFRHQFLQKAKRMIPDLKLEMIVKGLSGVRAQAMSVDGLLLMDFVIQRVDNQIHVLNTPSPGATSSLAIADYIIENYLTM